MPLTDISIAEEALSLPPAERKDLATLLIQSLEGESRTDREVTADLRERLEKLKSGDDPGLSFEQVFERPL